MSSAKLIEKLKSYKVYSNDCIFFKLVFSENDLNDKKESKNVFIPEFTHQIFGEEEIIFGYKNLQVNYYLTPGSMHAYIGLDYFDKISPQRFDGIEADDVYEAFQKFGCSPGFTRNLDTFCTDKLPLDYEFKPFGIKIHEYSRGSSSSKFEVYKVDSTNNEFHNQKFIDYLLRVQTMLIFFIETANFIDTDDDQWTFYFLYEKRQHMEKDRYITAGFLSLYNYYAFPDKNRLRVSQVLIMPNYQKQGHGSNFLKSVYMDSIADPNCVDITAESPSDEFIRVRDYVTCSMCMTLDSFQNLKQKKFSPEMVVEALKTFKIPKLQVRRCYEILRLRDTDETNEDEFKNYRLEIKKRLYMPFMKNKKCARNAGNVDRSGKSSEETNGFSKALSSRLDTPNGVTKTGFGKIPSDSVTTIGFGNSSSSKGTTTIGFSNGSASSVTTIGFTSTKSNGVKTLSLNKPVETTISSSTTVNGSRRVKFVINPTIINKNGPYEPKIRELDEDDSDGSEDEDEDQSENNTSLTNLFINEADRKIYLEKQFQQIYTDYKSIIERLDK